MSSVEMGNTKELRLLEARYTYIDSIIPTADKMDGPYPMWCGWALRNAFIAGAKWREDNKE